MVRYEAVARAYSDAVKRHLDAGMVINPPTMSGCEGEIAHVDFTDGKAVYRVLLEKQIGEGCAKLVISEGPACREDRVRPFVNRETIWNCRLEKQTCTEFYEITHDLPSNIYGTQEEAAEADRKRRERYRNRKKSVTTQNITDERELEIAYRYLARKTGRKIVKKNVQFYKDQGPDGRKNYMVCYKGVFYFIR